MRIAIGASETAKGEIESIEKKVSPSGSFLFLVEQKKVDFSITRMDDEAFSCGFENKERKISRWNFPYFLISPKHQGDDAGKLMQFDTQRRFSETEM